MAKNASGAAFMNAKKRMEEAILAEESGLELDPDQQEGLFAVQHHHLLSCLEKATVSPPHACLAIDSPRIIDSVLRQTSNMSPHATHILISTLHSPPTVSCHMVNM
ncbi:hypothetical protein C0Q70_15294 [Pomacea canaliculata]|uniref:Uncharacterized protein n=1 Tax=Pomacea canaliculata TaxID=400727 RepID=A0A2T7NUE3_POMCA|nr:hypothetical protein C0Q70_15294 [Pomacea canaliculata]